METLLFSLRRSGPYDKIKHIFTEERTYMKWMIRTGSTPAERARLRVVYAWPGLFFLCPDLFVIGGFSSWPCFSVFII